MALTLVDRMFGPEMAQAVQLGIETTRRYRRSGMRQHVARDTRAKSRTALTAERTAVRAACEQGDRARVRMATE
jgi:hypothetical protein